MAGAFDLTRAFPLVAGFCSLLLCACDKAEKLAKDAKAKLSEEVGAVKEKVEKATERVSEPEEKKETKSELDALVDQTPEGYQFRRDLPFSLRIDVSAETSIKMKGRFYKSSLLGKEFTPMAGTMKHTNTFSRNGDTVKIVGDRAPFEPDDEALKAKIKENGVKGERNSAVFVLKGGKWDVKNPGDLMAAAAAAEWKNGFSEMLAHEGVVARRQWFGKGRLKVGDSITLSGSDLGLFEVRPAKGKLVLSLETIESLDGHPCGVFSIRGTYECQGDSSSWGGSAHERISIESGRVWLSLLYPLILKEDFDAVLSASDGKKGDQLMRTQGSVHVTITRTWKPATGG